MAKAKTTSKNESETGLHPKQQDQLVGHSLQEQLLLKAYHEQRIPHAILLSGKKGIGKATFAYRLARFLLASGIPIKSKPSFDMFGEPAPAPDTSQSLYISPEHPTFKRVISGGHTDLLVLDSGDIAVDQTRKVSEFLSLTPAEANWRVVIIDGAEAMNRNAANSLLKILEEPPSQAIILLISHNSGALLPTIRSRCRIIKFNSLERQAFDAVLKNAAPHIEPEHYQKWAVLSDFSAGVAIQMQVLAADILYEELLELFSGSKNIASLHSFAEKFANKDNEAKWQLLQRLTLWLIARIATQQLASEVWAGEAAKIRQIFERKPLYFWSDYYEKCRSLFLDTDRLYLDKKQALITLFRGL